MEVLIGYGSLSDFESKLMEMDKIQIELRAAVSEIQAAKEQMEKEKKEMRKDLEENEEYKKVQEYSKYSLAIRQDQQEYLLQQLAAAKTPLEKEMARIEAELIELRSAMSKIQSYLAGWLLYQPSWSEIFSAVDHASNTTKVRSALLLATMQIESKFRPAAGSNAGSREGNLKRCLDFGCNVDCYKERSIFEGICREIGLSPNKVPISPCYAMGMVQVIPSTFKSYQRLYPTIKNPWNLNDAVLLMAYMLMRNGAASGNERGALAIYYCGSSDCKNSTYVNNVIYTANYGWQPVLDICGFNLSCPELRKRLEEKFGSIPIE